MSDAGVAAASPRSLRALIVDDEAPARRRLSRMLARITSPAPVEVVAEASDGLAALELLAAPESDALELDLAFVDIEMPGLDGLTLARVGRLPTLVFVTAHNEHALAAFEVGAVDYLLKPPSQARLAQTLARIHARIVAGPDSIAASELELRATLARFAGHPRSASVEPRVAVREGGTTRLFAAARIGHLWAANKYTVFHHEGREQLLDESLSELELRLGPAGFIRVHRRALVNLDWITAIHAEAGRVEVELRGGQRVDVSRRMAAELKRRLGL